MSDISLIHETLLAAACTSGSEDAVAAAIKNAAPKGSFDEVYSDALGNLIFHKKGKGKRIMCTAHMDAVGFMVTQIDDGGYLRVARLGGGDLSLLINARLVFKNGVIGVLRTSEAAKTAVKKPADLSCADLYVDIGAADKASAEKLVSVGSTCVFDGKPRKLLGDNVMTPYADNLIGCAVLISAMDQSRGSANDCCYVFTVQEEVGLRGAGCAAFAAEPEIAVNVDVAVASDDPQTKDLRTGIALSKGPAVKLMDGSVIPSKGLTSLLLKIASIKNIPCQKEISTNIGTDTGKVILTKGGVSAAAISVPIRNLHTPCEVYNKSDAEGAAKLLAAFLTARF